MPGRERLAYLAIAGPTAFAVLVALLHVLEPDTNDTEAISEYALGDYGLLMNGAFIAAAVGTGALALGLRGAIAPSTSARVALVLLGVATVGWILLGVGNVDPEGADTTSHGIVHGIGFLLEVPAMLAVPFVLARASRWDARWRPVRRALLALGAAALVTFALAFSDVASPVTFRLFVALELTTVVVTGVRLGAREREPQPRDEDLAPEARNR